jgi:hypothetical protein
MGSSSEVQVLCVKGESTVGTGVRATATTGTALRVAGRAKFSRSGKATVLKNKTYTDVTVVGGLTTRSVVNATLQTYRAGTRSGPTSIAPHRRITVGPLDVIIPMGGRYS